MAIFKLQHCIKRHLCLPIMQVLFSGVHNILVRIRITQPQGFQRHWKTLPLKFWPVKARPPYLVWVFS